jgi:hypothetical protein
MSGSNGGGGGGGPPDVGPIPCEMVAFETQLSSPKADVIANLKVGEILDVELRQEGGVQTIQVLRQGSLAGGLTAPDVKRLRECILSGHTYKAIVTALTGGQVKVRVKSA